ncbi:MAG: HepT-like ribonuclease domain-containing protein [Candidatus Hodarchaeales archaeon]
MRRDTGDYIEDIINAIDKALKFIEGMSYDVFVKDDRTIFAVIRAIEIIGEAVKNISDDIKEEYPEIPWKAMAGMRDKVIHGYFGVDTKVVWNTVQKRLIELRPIFEEISKRLEEE